MAADYYATLGVDRSAPQDEIKRAFRRIARQTHPDAHPGDPQAEASFRAAAEAYEVLSDPQRRAAYDRGDRLNLEGLFSSAGVFDDLIRSVFGEGGLFGGGARSENRRGRDVLVGAEIGLYEAVFGTTSDLTFRAAVDCEACEGSGAAEGTEPVRCETCGGAGQMRVARRSIFGSVVSVIACDRCDGTGWEIPEPCETCSGRGVLGGERSVSVEVPAGVTDGTRLRLTGRGESSGRLGAPGDLYVEIRVTPDERFERHGDDLVHVLALDIAEAALGTTIKVPIVDGGSTELTVPPGTQPGTLFRIEGKGVTRLGRRGRGDMFVRTDVEVPTRLTDNQADSLRRYREDRPIE